MANNLISDRHPAGSALFSGSESFMTDLSQEDESIIAGGTFYKDDDDKDDDDKYDDDKYDDDKYDDKNT